MSDSRRLGQRVLFRLITGWRLTSCRLTALLIDVGVSTLPTARKSANHAAKKLFLAAGMLCTCYFCNSIIALLSTMSCAKIVCRLHARQLGAAPLTRGWPRGEPPCELVRLLILRSTFPMVSIMQSKACAPSIKSIHHNFKKNVLWLIMVIPFLSCRRRAASLAFRPSY